MRLLTPDVKRGLRTGVAVELYRCLDDCGRRCVRNLRCDVDLTRGDYELSRGVDIVASAGIPATSTAAPGKRHCDEGRQPSTPSHFPKCRGRDRPVLWQHANRHS